MGEDSRHLHVSTGLRVVKQGRRVRVVSVVVQASIAGGGRGERIARVRRVVDRGRPVGPLKILPQIGQYGRCDIVADVRMNESQNEKAVLLEVIVDERIHVRADRVRTLLILNTLRDERIAKAGNQKKQ